MAWCSYSFLALQQKQPLLSHYDAPDLMVLPHSLLEL
jgi:hypothetical protein